MSAGAAIVSDKQLGDVLLLQPSAAHLAQQTGAPTALFVREAFRPMIDLMPGCCWGPETDPHYQQVWTTSWSSRAVWQSFKLRTKQRKLIVNKPRHIRWWYRFLFHEIRLQPPAAEYWARYFWRSVSGSDNAQFTPPQLLPPPASWKHPQAPADSYILINPTAAWSRKFWGAKQWGEVITELTQKDALPFVIAGGGSDKEVAHCQSIADACKAPVINLAGQTSMQQYLHLLSQARMVLCIDGAASHLAQAFDRPTVTIFGPTDERKWHWPTHRHRVLAARQHTEITPATNLKTLSADRVPVGAVLTQATDLLDIQA